MAKTRKTIMDMLAKAKEAANRFSHNEEGTFGDVAMVYAAIAQAEALERIADMLERHFGPVEPVDPELAGYRKYGLSGESIDEYQRRIAEYVEDKS